MSKGKPPAKSSDTSANLGFEAKLWLAADTALRDSAFLRAGGKLQVMPERQDNLRNNMDAAEPSGARQPERSGDSPACFNSKRTGQTAKGSPKGERGSTKQYLAANGFWVPADARWPQLQSRAKLPSIGKDVDGEMSNVECGMSNFRLTNSTFETG